MKSIARLLGTLSLGLGISACSLDSSISELAETAVTPVAKVTGLTNFDLVPSSKQMAVTPENSYQVSFSMGTGPQGVKEKTGGGYTVYLNFQGQLIGEGE